MAEQRDRRSAVQQLATTLHEGLAALLALDAPVVAAVHAAAAGAGLSLVLACDIAIAADSATFSTGYSAVGLSPDGGLSWLLPRAVGLRRATELLVTNRAVSAPEAVEIGLVTRAVPAIDLPDEVKRVVRSLVSGPTQAFGATKRLLLEGMTRGLQEHLPAEAASIAHLAGSALGEEGIRAFLDKRPAQFTVP